MTTPAALAPGREDLGVVVGTEPGGTRTSQGGTRTSQGGSIEALEMTLARTTRLRVSQPTPGNNTRNTVNEQ